MDLEVPYPHRSPKGNQRPAWAACCLSPNNLDLQRLGPEKLEIGWIQSKI